MAEKKEIKYTRYEIARMLGSRSLQIAMGAPFLVKITNEDLERMKYNPVKIAKLELEKDVIPITVRRPLPETEEEK